MSSLKKAEAKLINENLGKHERLFYKISMWTSFYRANPHRFAKDYLNLDLKMFQQVMLVMMFVSDYFMAIMSRGIGKSNKKLLHCPQEQ